MFDLDGTLTDSERAITGSVRHALSLQGIKDQPVEKLRTFIGPSLYDSFVREYGMSEEDALRGVRDYRADYEAGRLYDVDVYPGIPGLIERLHAAGRCLVLVTSKPEMFSGKILEHIGLRKFFTYISAPAPAVRDSNKSGLILGAADVLGLKKEECVMIGDTSYDILGARDAGVASIGVTYGFGSRESLISAGADYIADDASELGKILLG